MAPPDFTATPPTTLWPISLPAPLIPQTWPLRICRRHPSRYLNSWQGCHSSVICPYCRSTLTSVPLNSHSRCWPPPLGPPAGLHHLHLTFHPISFHPWSGGHLPPPLSNNNMLKVNTIISYKIIYSHKQKTVKACFSQQLF